MRHPVVDHRGDSMRRIIGLTTADETFTGVNTHQQQAGHDRIGNRGFNFRDLHTLAFSEEDDSWWTVRLMDGFKGKQGLAAKLILELLHVR